MRITIALCILLAVSSVACGDETPKTWVSALQHADESIREAAAEHLIESGDEAVPGLLDAVQRRPENHAARAAFVLTQIHLRSQDSRPALTEPALIEPELIEPELIEPELIEPALIETLSDPNAEPWRWSLAANLVLRLSPSLLQEPSPSREEVVSAVMPALSLAEQPIKRYAAIKLVYYLGRDGMGAQADVTAHRLINILSSVKGNYSEVPIDRSTFRDPLHGRIVHIVVDEDPCREDSPWRYFTTDQLIIAAARKTYSPDDRRVLAALRSHLQELCQTDVPTVQLDAARQLEELDSPQAAVATLQNLLASWQKDEIREQAVETLGHLKQVAVPTIPRLVELLKSKSPKLRCASAEAIGEIAMTMRSSPPRHAELLKLAERSLEQALRAEQLLLNDASAKSGSSDELCDVADALEVAHAIVRKALTTP